MSDITSIERIKLERLLDMSSGYVLDFSNSSFESFIIENTGFEIYDEKYGQNSGSKANRLRAFWRIESNYIVGKLLMDLFEYINAKGIFSDNFEKFSLQEDCKRIAARLLQNNPVDNIDAIQATNDDKDFNLLAKTIRESIIKNEPEIALDRLHTFIIRYIRDLLIKHNIPYSKDTALHSLFGSYVNYLKKEQAIESEMSIRILKSSISILESYNDIRNNRSFAHDNPVLNYNESILILNSISNVIRFIEAIEMPSKNRTEVNQIKNDLDIDDLPF
ncbi:MAG: abortive infection family protein [Prolixibacteraceae bacterium]|nr:abortive infection family protein [Prolixibacteraceae bacterium]